MHAAVNAADSPLLGCMRCGAWSAAGVLDERRKLLGPCQPPTSYGAAALRALRSGRHPTANSASSAYGARHGYLVPVLAEDLELDEA